jgi:predicted flap endonuclease-1-like 5' DNA nuclease
VGGVPEDVAQESMRLAIQKLPLKCKIVARPDYHTVAPPADAHTEDDTSITATIVTNDLTKIYGLGKTLAAQLEAAGITTFAALAELPLERLREIVTAQGTDEASVNEETWAEQARLLDAGDYDAFAEYVERLRVEDGNVITAAQPQAAPETPADEAEGDGEQTNA